mgnify:CR=1 FL=1
MGGSPILPDRSMSQYTRNPPLDISDLHHDPLTQFQSWLQAAREIGQIEPGAFVLSTADADGRPSGRVVLFKGIHQGALCFYTDYRGRKAAELDAKRAIAQGTRLRQSGADRRGASVVPG